MMNRENPHLLKTGDADFYSEALSYGLQNALNIEALFDMLAVFSGDDQQFEHALFVFGDDEAIALFSFRGGRACKLEYGIAGLAAKREDAKSLSAQ